MTVNFYTVSKRHNSTKLPTGGTSKACLLKEASSVQNPTIVLKWSGSGDPTAYNMCYISDYGRYYWIDNWTYTDRCWVASCSVDVLASYKTEIGNSTKYVLRSASTYDPHVPDNKYMPIRPLTIAQWAISGFAWAQEFQYGSFVMGVTGQGNTFGLGGVGFVALTASMLPDVLSACFTESENIWTASTSLGSTIGEVFAKYGENLQKSMANPIQFINSLCWVPFPISGMPVGSQISLKLGAINTGIQVYQLNNPVHTDSFTIATPSLNGVDDWMNLEPFVKHVLHLPPFPDQELPGQFVLNSGANISGSIYTDVTNGMAYLEINSSTPVVSCSARLGVMIDLAGSSVDYAGQIMSAAQTVQSGIGALFNPASAISGVTSGIVGFAQASQPQANGGGYSGSMASVKAAGNRVLLSYYWTVPELDDQEIGKPLMQKKQISTLSGFVLCADGDVPISGTPAEHEQLLRFLTEGFFYE